MLLAIDVGNASISLGTIEDGAIGSVVRIHTDINATTAEYGIRLQQLLNYYGIDPKSFDGAIICSVVPTVTEALRSAVRHLTGLDSLVVGPGIKTGLNVRIDDPSSLGGDLVVGSVAAIACYGSPSIVIDFGTATTMVLVDERGCYRGGVFVPGVELGLRALSAGTSLLPDISLAPPKKVIGTNTVEAIRSGAAYGTAAMIDGMIERMEEEAGCRCRVIATGRLSKSITAYCRKEVICDENLILKGLWVLYQKNMK